MNNYDNIQESTLKKEDRRRDLLEKIRKYNDLKQSNEKEIASLQNENVLLEQLILESQRHYGVLSEKQKES